MSYKLNEFAKEDLLLIHEFGVRRFGEMQADKYLKGLFEKFDEIAANPKSFPSVKHIKRNYRRAVYNSNSIYFKIEEKVEIMRVIGRQNF